MSEMVERVARALYDVDPSLWVGEDKMGYYRRAAHAAIEAVREQLVIWSGPDFSSSAFDGAIEMIDEALK